MPFRKRYALGPLAILLTLCAAYVGLFGLLPENYDIEYDEEVQLHDGRIVVVHVKRYYQRKGLRLERYPKDPYRVGMEFSFDRSAPAGRFTHHLKNGNLNFLDESGGKWYAGYYADESASASFGSHEIYPHVAILNADGSVTKPRSWEEIPGEIRAANIMPATPDESAMSKFDGKRLSLSAKMQHWKNYPTGAGEHSIQRITPQRVSAPARRQ